MATGKRIGTLRISTDEPLLPRLEELAILLDKAKDTGAKEISLEVVAWDGKA